MELSIKITDKKIYESLLQFLKSLGIKTISVSEERTVKTDKGQSGKKMSLLLEKLSLTGGIKSIEDPLLWQKKIRQDRPLR